MLPGRYAAVLQARAADELRREIDDFTRQIGFATFSAMTVVERTDAATEFITIDNTPPEFAAEFRDPGLGRRDPVMQHCRRSSVPIVWDRFTYEREHAGELWAGQARFGFRTGIALAQHLPEGRHFQFGVDRAEPLPQETAALRALVAEVVLFALHAQDAALRLLLPPHAPPPLPPLTAREREALRWTMEGKTAWEIGAILGISERTAVLHLSNATHKLGCNHKHHAVLKALRLGVLL